MLFHHSSSLSGCLSIHSKPEPFFPDEVIVDDTRSYPIDMEVLEAPKFEGGEDYAVQQGKMSLRQKIPQMKGYFLY